VDTQARTRTTIDARGLKTVRTYDEWDKVTNLTYADGASVAFSYDPVYSHVTQHTDERGVTTRYEYDAKGNLKKMTQALGKPEQRIIEFICDSLGRLLSETKKGATIALPGNAGTVTVADAVTTFEYNDPHSNITAIVDPGNHRIEWSNYDAVGNFRTKKDARGKLWTRTYNDRGQLLLERNPLGHTKKREYDKAGWLIKGIDAAGNDVVLGYDARKNITSVTDPYGGVVRFEYDTHNQLIKQTDQEGRGETTEYDSDGRRSKRIDGNGNKIQYVYGDTASGLSDLLTAIVYPSFTRELKYDLRNRVVETIDVLDASTRYSAKIDYDATGNPIRRTDRENKATSFEYDALGRIVKVIDPATAVVTEYIHDPRDNVIGLKNAKGQLHRFEYDRRNLQIREAVPGGQSIRHTYDPAGKALTVTNPNGQQLRFEYDDAGRRITERHYLTAADSAPIKTITYGYNDLGRKTTWSDGLVSGEVQYDTKQHRKLGEIVDYGGVSLSYRYEYHPNGLKKSFTGPDGVTVRYEYDDNNQLTSLALPTGNMTVNQYRWLSPEKIILPGGATRTHEYDALMRVTGTVVKDPNQNQVMSQGYIYDKNNHITQKNTEHGTYTYVYDDLYRLTAVTNPGPLANETYTYDALGNRMTDASTSGDWQYNDNNQLLALPGTTFEYDDNGNMVSKADASADTTFVYDIRNRVSEVRRGGETIATYYYDPFDRRLSKEVGNNRTYFLHADEGLAAEADNTGSVSRLYGYEPGTPWGTAPVYLKQANRYYFFQNDRLGTPQRLLSQEGRTVWHAKARAFGATNVDSASTVTNNLRFAGQYFDHETGLHYNRHRYYDPRLGRYLTPDPIGLAGGVNFYAYVENDPINMVDPTGLAGSFYEELYRIYQEINRTAATEGGKRGKQLIEWMAKKGMLDNNKFEPMKPKGINLNVSLIVLCLIYDCGDLDDIYFVTTTVRMGPVGAFCALAHTKIKTFEWSMKKCSEVMSEEECAQLHWNAWQDVPPY